MKFYQVAYEEEGKSGEGADPPKEETKEEVKVETKEEPKVESKEASKKEEKPWYYGRIDELTKELRTTQARAQELERHIAAAQPKAPKEGEKVPAGYLPEEEVNRRAFEIARAEAAQRDFNTRCNAIADGVEKEFGHQGLSQVVTALKSVCGSIYEAPQLVEALSEAEEPAKIIHHLGTNPSELMDLMTLPPVKLAARINKIDLEFSGKKEAKEPKKASNLPDPIKPQIGKGGNGARSLEEVSDVDEWMAMREKMVKEREAERRR